MSLMRKLDRIYSDFGSFRNELKVDPSVDPKLLAKTKVYTNFVDLLFLIRNYQLLTKYF